MTGTVLIAGVVVAIVNAIHKHRAQTSAYSAWQLKVDVSGYGCWCGFALLQHLIICVSSRQLSTDEIYSATTLRWVLCVCVSFRILRYRLYRAWQMPEPTHRRIVANSAAPWMIQNEVLKPSGKTSSPGPSHHGSRMPKQASGSLHAEAFQVSGSGPLFDELPGKNPPTTIIISVDKQQLPPPPAKASATQRASQIPATLFLVNAQ